MSDPALTDHNGYTVDRFPFSSWGDSLYDQLNALYLPLPGQHVVTPEILERASYHGSALLIARPPHDRTLIGMATVAPVWLPYGSEAHVKDVMVQPAHRRRGVGTQLLLAAVILAERDGLEKLCISIKDPKIQRLCTLFGFEGFGEEMSIVPSKADLGRFDQSGILI